MGEGVWAIRDMADPPRLGDPDTYRGEHWYPVEGCTPDQTSDWCGVHTNCGVPNKMFYLLSDGGTFNGVTVEGIGIQTAMRIGLDANRNWWGAAATFAQAREGRQAAVANCASWRP